MPTQFRSSRRPYTMIELIVVMFIAVVLMTIGLSSFRDWRKGHEVDDATRTIGSLILQTRQAALAKRRYVALIMPGPESGTGLADEDLYVYARLGYVTRSGSTYTFDSWVEDRQWVRMTTGTTIMEVDSDLGLQNAGDFQKTPHQDSVTKVDAVDLTELLQGQADVDGIRSLVFSPSGRLKGGTTIYVTVGDAVYMQGTWVMRGAARLVENGGSGTVYDIGPANQTSVQVNQYTGLTTYFAPTSYKTNYNVE